MSKDRFRLLHDGEIYDQRAAAVQLARSAWPEFMWHDAAAHAHWHELFERFPSYQAVLFDTNRGRIAALGHSLPFHWTGELTNLPEDGWDWVIHKGVEDDVHGVAPNTQAAIMVAIHPEYRRQGLSVRIVQSLEEIGRARSLSALVVPVRPYLKSRYPLTSMDDYITWTSQHGLPFDYWLRVHIRLGGQIVKVCHQAKTVRGSRSDWETWTQMKFPQTGEYIVPGALNPISIDVERDEGVYIEPNVWVSHKIL